MKALWPELHSPHFHCGDGRISLQNTTVFPKEQQETCWIHVSCYSTKVFFFISLGIVLFLLLSE